MYVVAIILALIALLHVCLLLCVVLRFLLKHKNEVGNLSEGYSNYEGAAVVIPFKNEDVTACVESCIHQSIGPRKIILSGDNPANKSVHVSWSMVNSHSNVELITARYPAGKKYALNRAMQLADTDVVCWMDADSTADEWWLAIALSKIESGYDAVMFLPRVRGDSMLSLVDMMDISSHFVVAEAIHSLFGYVLTASAAGLCFRKELWYDIKNKWIEQVKGSGDDVFLVQAMAERGYKIAYEFQPAITTAASRSIRHYINRRIRWGSKWGDMHGGIIKWAAGSWFALSRIMYAFVPIILFFLHDIKTIFLIAVANMLMWIVDSSAWLLCLKHLKYEKIVNKLVLKVPLGVFVHALLTTIVLLRLVYKFLVNTASDKVK